MDGGAAALVESVESEQAIGDTPTRKRDVTQFVIGESDVVDRVWPIVHDLISVFDRIARKDRCRVGRLG